MKVFIADPALKDHHGHHYAITERFSSSVCNKGNEVIWLVNKKYQLEKTDKNFQFMVDPMFTEDTYDGYGAKSVQGGTFLFRASYTEFKKKFMCTLRAVYESSPGIVQKAANLFYRVACKSIRDKQKSLANEEREAITPQSELLQSLNRHGFSSDDCVMFHTCDAHTYRDVLAFFTKALSVDQWNRFPVFILSTPFDMCVMPHNLPDDMAAHSIKHMQVLGLIDSRVMLCAENELLASQLSKEWGVKVSELYLPNEGYATVTDNDVQHSVLNISYFGAARTEKGFVPISEAVIEYLANTEKLDICFTVQITPQIMGYTSDIELAVSRLKAINDGRLTLICDIQKPDQYKANLLKADIILLIYDVDRYAVRSSGIAIEALENAKNVISTEGTFPAYLAGDAGVTVKNDTDIISAFYKISENRGVYKQAARKRQKWLVDKCSINRLYDIINRAKKVGISECLFKEHAFNGKRLTWRKLI